MDTIALNSGGKETAAQAPEGKYGFYGRLTEAFPSQVIIDCTEVCNLACVHCPHPTFKLSEHYHARYLDPELNRKIVDEVRDFGKGCTQYIRYTAEGEPLIHPRGYEMIEYAVRNSGVFVTLTTNGTIMDERRTKRLLDAGVHMIDISIDAFTPETYAKIRVNGDLEVTRANVNRLLEWKRQTPTKVVVSFIEQPGNSREAEDFERYWTEQGADRVVIRRLHSAAGAVTSIAEQLRKEEHGTPRYPCLYPWERVLLNPRGAISFCPQDWVCGSKVADYRETTVHELWRSDFYRRLREAHLKNDFSRHSFCGNCPDWRQTRWPNEGLSYADLVVELGGVKTG
ncbi:MAG: radical SAM protein [Gammaproteobacteria bacterium]|nr:radical SAM protein [Gammaproteobacteria bacterium]